MIRPGTRVWTPGDFPGVVDRRKELFGEGKDLHWWVKVTFPSGNTGESVYAESELILR